MAKQERETPAGSDPAADPVQAAQAAGLRHVSDTGPGIGREPHGADGGADGGAGAWRYRQPGGRLVRDAATLERIAALAIPPAWREVWICPRPDGHLQATGRDARGRKQYRYHPRFRAVRESTKYAHMVEFAQALPAIRAAVARHLALRGLPREKVLATVVRLLESTLIRVGNDDYARENRSYGLTTLRNRHVRVDGGELRFQFKGKSGKVWQLRLRDRRLARIVRACQELPGQELFQYVDDAGELRTVGSADVNAYLREISGRDITAKDFRTWAGTVLAALALHAMVQAEAEGLELPPRPTAKALRAAVEEVAGKLGNTPAICRKCYIHPEVIEAYLAGELRLLVEDAAAGAAPDSAALRPEEAAVLAMLQGRARAA